MDSRYRICEGPFWFDACHHGDDCYVGSFTVQRPDDWIKHDVYVWIQHGSQHLCVRDGNKAEDYLSCGNINDLFSYPNHIDIIDIALVILRIRGELVWHKGGVLMGVKGE